MELPFTIECQGATTVNIDELHELHHFKTMKDEQYAHMRNSITELGFSFPIFMWIDPDGKKWIVDAHQRIRVLKRWRGEAGFVLPELPADLIFAKDKKEAAKKIIAHELRGGDPNETEFVDFLKSYEIEFEEIGNYFDIPGLNEDNVDKSKKEKKLKQVTCPECNAQFEV